LDAAVLLGFAFKLKFDYLNHTQRETAFHCYFDALLKPSGKLKTKRASGLSGFQYLTPGDFEVVWRSCQFQIKAAIENSLLNEFETEMRLKPVCAKRKVGF